MQRVRVLRFAELSVMPWKNGLGVTRELVSVGGGAEGEFGWRLSMADIGVDAPFSMYAGIERHLAVVAGGPLELVVEGTARRIEIGGVETFAGDATVSARPLEQPVTDLNLMVDTTKWSGSLAAVSAFMTVRAAASVAVLALRDAVTVRLTDADGSRQDFALDALDCLLADGAVALSVESAAEATLTRSVAMLVEVDPRISDGVMSR